MATTPQIGMRIGGPLLTFIDALAKYLNPDNPSRAHAVSHMARHFPLPDSSDPASLHLRLAHRELVKRG